MGGAPVPNSQALLAAHFRWSARSAGAVRRKSHWGGVEGGVGAALSGSESGTAPSLMRWATKTTLSVRIIELLTAWVAQSLGLQELAELGVTL